jgi:murein L,D-transpeptidase YcbB/YkuD
MGMWRKAFFGLALAGVAACGERAAAPPAPKAGPAAATAMSGVLLDPEIADFYRERGHRPLWVAGDRLRPAALRVAALIRSGESHGLDPARYGAAEIDRAISAARSGDRAALAHAELLLTRGFTAFVRDLRLPAAPQRLHYVDDELRPAAPSPRALLESVAAAPSIADRVAAATRTNPLYGALQRGYARWRSSGPRSPAEEALVRANLDRARLLPAEGRHIIVDTGSARLWMIDGGRVEGPMKVIVGKAGMRTPSMAGFIRFAVLNPYWNLPPDLARERAKRVLKQGTGWLARERLEILSDWGPNARVLRPSQVDWRAVASGKRPLRIRQLPGGANVMGDIKFMLPNSLGIYLHDFPDKSLFARADRRLSSGCVRVEDAARLARWLYGGAAPRPDGPAPEQRVDLPEPVPVYITHLTVLPDPETGLSFQRDV